MPPFLASFVWIICLIVLLRFDPSRISRFSLALWLPVIWMFILGSRNPAQWFGGELGLSAQALEDGNPLDRTIYFVLILLAIGVLMSRSFKWSSFFTHNLVLTAYLLFALMSACWSDFSLIAFKRWFRDLGSYLMVLVVLSDPRPLEAFRAVLRRISYLLIPLSILLDKYYPQLSKQYDEWTGAGYYVGATTSKNMLGLLCLVSGLFFFWDTVTRWPERKERRTKRILLLNTAFFAITLWLMHTAQSTTSSVCLVIGCLVIGAAHSKVFRRHRGLLKALIPASFCLYLILDFVCGLNGSMAATVGKDPTLTDRTKIWAFLLSMHTNPLIGTGYQSFWMGPRLELFWNDSGLGHINEAHNGYLQVYLELGLIGLSLLVGFLVASYRGICRRLKSSSSLAVLGLALWLAIVFYNMSEAAFESGLLYTVFLIGATALPERTQESVQSAVAFNDVNVAEKLPVLPLEAAGTRAAKWFEY